MKQNICLWFVLICFILYLTYHQSLPFVYSKEHFAGPSPDYITFDPKSTAINPFGKVAQVMFNLQNPRDCDAFKRAVLDNPSPTQEQVDALYQCLHNPYDRMLIKNLPFGQSSGG